jgi:hypothetical protein
MRARKHMRRRARARVRVRVLQRPPACARTRAQERARPPPCARTAVPAQRSARSAREAGGARRPRGLRTARAQIGTDEYERNGKPGGDSAARSYKMVEGL